MQRQSRSAVAACALLVGLLAAGPAATQPPAVADPPADGAAPGTPPVFEVELLVFAYNDFNPTEEAFPPERPRWPKRLRGVRLGATPETLPGGSAAWLLDDVLLPAGPSGDGAPASAGTPAGTAPPFDSGGSDPLADEYGNSIGTAAADGRGDGRWYRLLAPGELALGRARSRLSGLDAYTPLLHVGWSQAALLENEAQAFELEWLGSLRPAGSIRLHRSRFLHLTLDIALQSDYRYRQAPPAPEARWPLAEIVGPVKYRIAVQRRVRTGEVHFFDHPAFGVLVVVRPAPEADGQAPEGPAA